jgi:hypothetical protein
MDKHDERRDVAGEAEIRAGLDAERAWVRAKRRDLANRVCIRERATWQSTIEAARVLLCAERGSGFNNWLYETIEQGYLRANRFDTLHTSAGEMAEAMLMRRMACLRTV